MPVVDLGVNRSYHMAQFRTVGR
ncbi:uncharacterized protein METZ01_LOCUS285707 [marine metagenome]|uniref:Uncharacterized protein n=1 Tax=marine metagenome TaxID=408172 RepID=A0A382LA07_9ZZZZ